MSVEKIERRIKYLNDAIEENNNIERVLRAELFEKKVDYIFIPSIVSTKVNYPENKHNKLCPFVQSFPYQAKAIFSCNGQSSCNNGGYPDNTTEILTVALRFGEGRKLMRKTFFALGRKLVCSRRAVIKAIKEGLIVQKAFEKTGHLQQQVFLRQHRAAQ